MRHSAVTPPSRGVDGAEDGWCGGVAGGVGGVQALARKGDPTSVPLPVPMQARKDMNFSYAGLKNAFRMAMQVRVTQAANTSGSQAVVTTDLA